MLFCSCFYMVLYSYAFLLCAFSYFLLEMQSWRANLPSCEFLRRESSLTKSPDDMVLCSFFFSSELAGWNNIGTGNILRQNGKMRRRKKRDSISSSMIMSWRQKWATRWQHHITGAALAEITFCQTWCKKGITQILKHKACNIELKTNDTVQFFCSWGE